MSDRRAGDATLAQIKKDYYEYLIDYEATRKKINQELTLDGIQTNLALIGKLAEYAQIHGIFPLDILRKQEEVYHTVLSQMRDGTTPDKAIYDQVRAADEAIDKLLNTELRKKNE